MILGDASTSVEVRLGSLEDVQRSEGEEIGLRVFIGRRSATVSSSDMSKDALDALVDRVVAMAREAPEDPYAGLAPKDRLARGKGSDVEGDDGRDPAPTELKECALAMEAAARAVESVDRDASILGSPDPDDFDRVDSVDIAPPTPVGAVVQPDVASGPLLDPGVALRR